MQAEREAGEENQVTEVHGIAAVGEGAARHQPLGRIVHPRSATAEAQPVTTGQAILQVSPGEEGEGPWLEA